MNGFQGESLSWELNNGVVEMALHRDPCNEIGSSTLDDLERFAAAIESSKDEAHAVIIHSRLKCGFSAGADLRELYRRSQEVDGKAAVEGVREFLQRIHRVLNIIDDSSLTTIAAVHGVAFGGGFQLALGPDIRIVAPDTRMAVLEIKWGLVPDMAGLVLMKGLLRDDVARELTYTGRIFSGEEALTMGLATRVSTDPHGDAMKMAIEIAGKNPDAIRAGKRLLNMAGDADQKTILVHESKEQGALIGSPNQVEAVMSNMQKRAATYAD